MPRGDEDSLEPLFGKLPPDVLRVVLGHLTPFERALFARASGSCFRACERSGLGRAGVDRQDRGHALKASEMVASQSMFEWTRRDSGLDEETFYKGRYIPRLARYKSFVELALETATFLGDLE